MLVSKERFNQDLIDIEGKELYSYGNYYTDGSMIVDNRCGNFQHCEIKPLKEDAFNISIKPLINEEKLEEIVKPENEIIEMWETPLYGVNLCRTKTKYILIGEEYYNIFEECTDAYYKDNMIYFFLDLPKIEEDEEDALMFVAAVMVCRGSRSQVDNIIKINNFYDALEKIQYDKQTFKTEFEIKKEDKQ